jgi:hypothetical protein
MDTFLYKIADFSLNHAKSIVITSAIIIVVAIFFAAQMHDHMPAAVVNEVMTMAKPECPMAKRNADFLSPVLAKFL